MTWMRRTTAVLIWIAAVLYLVCGMVMLLLGAIDGHWLLYSGIAGVLVGILLLYASTAACRGTRFPLTLVGAVFTLLLLPPLGLVALALCLIARPRRAAV